MPLLLQLDLKMKMLNRKRNSQRAGKTKSSISAVGEPKQKKEPRDSSILDLFSQPTDYNILHGSRQNSNSSPVTETVISLSTDASTAQPVSLSIKHTEIFGQNDAAQLEMVKENEISIDQNNSSSLFSLRQPVLEITNSNCRPKTPENPIAPEEIFSPNTINEFKSTVRVLFPDGPPPPPPIIPVKKHKKRDIPYIVGCTRRRRVPESKTLKFFKGDAYGITSKTNEFVEDGECTPKNRRRRIGNGNWSKSLFNPKSEEIAARLKLNERVDELLRKSPNKESDSFKSNSSSSKPQAFSPLPSTSKDRETILKNEKSFNASINYNSNNYELGDEEELPKFFWGTEGKEKKTNHELYSLRNNLETISKTIVIDEDVNNNNDTDVNEIDFCEILSKRKKHKTENLIAPLHGDITPIQYTSGPSKIDETIINLENVIEDLKPKANISNNKSNDHKIIATIEIKDDYSEIIHEDLYSVPKAEDVVDIDEVLAELDTFKKKLGRNMRKSIVTVIDPISLLECSEIKMETVDLVTPSSSFNPTKTECALNKVSSTVIEMPEITEPVDVSNYVPTRRDNPPTWNNDVELINETSPDKTIKTSTKELRLRNSTNIDNITAGSNNDFEIVRNDFDNHGDIVRDTQMLLMLLATSCNNFSQTINRNPKGHSPDKLPAREQGFPCVNNENEAPATSGQTPATIELGECPICMDRLSKNSLASTICGHVFCVVCIKRCGKRCPTCRKQFKGIGYHQVFL